MNSTEGTLLFFFILGTFMIVYAWYLNREPKKKDNG